tara:strand:+ start:698 stop:1318 length:621 start_codon:yes stop_codon:yes gene_type:complete
MFKNVAYLFGQTIVAILLMGFWGVVFGNLVGGNSGNGVLLAIPCYVGFGILVKKEKWQKSLVDAIAGLGYVFSMVATMMTAGLAVPTAIVVFIIQMSAYAYLVNNNLVIGWTKDNFAQTLYNDILQVCDQNNVNIEKGVKAKIVRDYLNTFLEPKYKQHFAEPEFKKFVKQKLTDGKSFHVNSNELLKLCNSLSPFFKKVYMKEYK